MLRESEFATISTRWDSPSSFNIHVSLPTFSCTEFISGCVSIDIGRPPARPAFRAVLDVWPSGCWHFPNITCGPPLGKGNWPAESDINLPNVMPLAGMAMRDAVFWRDSVTTVAGNLDRLASGKPLKNVVRNATA